MKRPLEAILAGVSLLALLPVCLIAAFLVRLVDHYPILVRQEWVGRWGTRFRVIKFRTMRARPAIDLHRQATPNDSRITPVGRILQVTALDEFPQLLNVLRGEMSFVGPRALLPQEIGADPCARYHRIEDVPNYDIRTSVLPGLTGLAQVYAPRDISHQKKFRYDALYVRRMSLCLDLRLIAVSIFISLIGRWPRRGHPTVHRRRG